MIDRNAPRVGFFKPHQDGTRWTATLGEVPFAEFAKMITWSEENLSKRFFVSFSDNGRWPICREHFNPYRVPHQQTLVPKGWKFTVENRDDAIKFSKWCDPDLFYL